MKRPNSNGWWFWFEAGCGDHKEAILLRADGKCVAYDDEWEAAMGRKPDEIYCENYWEGTDTTQKYMPGRWEKITDPAILAEFLAR